MAARKGTQTSKEQLSQWYFNEKKTTHEIAGLLRIDQSNVIYWMKKLGVPRRSKSNALTKTWRADFSGDLEEKAYLLGFRLGDLHVSRIRSEGETIRIVCASTRMEQIELIQRLFEHYGYIKTTKKIDGKTMISCYVNLSFEFLLPKQDFIEQWILTDKRFGLQFLAGYIDAEGCFGIDANGSGTLKIESYDVTILHELYQILTHLEIARQKLNQDLWRLGVYRKSSLDRLCYLLDPCLRHGQRRTDMTRIWNNVQERLAR